ncbi:MAG: DNA methyltransferase, partial [Thermomicrobiales bacterium]
MIPAEFVHKWTHLHLTEKAGAHSWFIDLCAMLDMPFPGQQGHDYIFEQSAAKLSGGTGWADVWYRGHFAREFKGRAENLDKAYQQLKNYAEALENPPLLVVSDFDRVIVHTNFTNAPRRVHRIPLAEIGQEEHLKTLKALWEDPDALKPGYTPEEVTAAAANQLGALALALRDRGVEPHRAAHFTVELLFCFFAEDIGLLPKGLFTQLLDFGSKAEVPFNQELEKLLNIMRDGGYYNLHTIPRFNGGLFDEIVVEPLNVNDIRSLRQISGLDWGRVEPAIFGTLFERSLDPGRRSQLGAHYTGVNDIERVVEPVVMVPLRRRWEEVQKTAEPIAAEWKAASIKGATAQSNRQREAFRKVIDGFLAELKAVTILDPACGSGNFLYVALRKLMDLEKEVIGYAAGKGLPRMFPTIEPDQMLGLEINEYAVEITRTVVWIGFLQWRIQNGFGYSDPVLKPLDTIRLQDALLDLSDPEQPKEAVWPAADYIIGNPPFLGAKKLRSELGDEY